MHPTAIVTLLALVLLPAFSEAACGCLNLQKRYDANVDGVSEPGDVNVPWTFKVKNLATGEFAYYNSNQTLQLPFGKYEVCALPPQQYNWYPTNGALCNNYTLADSTCVNAVDTCACLGNGNARSAVFWTSTSGVATVTNDDLTALNALNLVDSSDAPVTLTSGSLAAWINGATSSNAQYYLSVQLALSVLNTRHGVSTSAAVKAPAYNTLVGNPGLFATIGDLQATATSLLASWTAGSATSAGIVADALSATNQNQNYVQASPCVVTFAPSSDAGSATDFAAECPSCVLGCIKLIKFYDANGNGIMDDGTTEGLREEFAIENWVFQVTNLDSGNTSYYNSTQEITDLPLGHYQVCDLASKQTNWKLTGPNGLCVNVTLTDRTCVPVLRGCACTAPTNVHSSGYWTTPVPPPELGAPEVSAFNSLPLITPTGSKWTPASATEFKNWFNLAQYFYNNPSVPMNSPNNPAYRTPYWLSAQLALSKLQTMHFINPLYVVYSPASNAGSFFSQPGSYYTVGQLQAWASSLLQTPTVNLPAQVAVLTALLTVNQNEGFISSSPCPFSFNLPTNPSLASLSTTCPPPPPSTTGFATTGCQQACLRLQKIYDANGNGIQDNGEVETSSTYRVRNLATNNYAYYTVPQTLGLPFGTYEVCEQIPQQYNWYLTKGGLCTTFVLNTPACVATNSTCFCTGGGSAQSANFWRGTVGKATMDGNDISSLATLQLRNGANALVSLGSANDIANFIGGATASSPAAYWLSAQLALSVLNTNHFVNPTGLVKAIAVVQLIGGPAHGFLPLQDVQTYAAQLLAAASPNAAHQLTTANILAPVNQNQGFVQSNACTATYAAMANSPSKNGLLSPCTGDTAGNPSSFIINGDNLQTMDGSNGSGAGMSTAVMGIIAGCVTGAVVLGAVAVVAVKKYGSRISAVTPGFRRGMDKSESQVAINLSDISLNPELSEVAASPKGLEKRRPSIVHSPSFHT